MVYRILAALLIINSFFGPSRAEPLVELDELRQGLENGDARDKVFFFGATDDDLKTSRCFKAQHHVAGTPDITPEVGAAYVEAMILYCQELAMIFNVPLFDYRENGDFCSKNGAIPKLKSIHRQAQVFLQNPDQRIIGAGLKLILLTQLIAKKKGQACGKFGQAL